MKTVIDVNTLTTQLVKEGIVVNPNTVKEAVERAGVETFQFSRSFGTDFSEKKKGGYEILILEESIPSIVNAIKEIQKEGKDTAQISDLYIGVREKVTTITKGDVSYTFSKKKDAIEFFRKEEGLKALHTRIKDGAVIRGWSISMKKSYHTEFKMRYRVLGGK